MTEESASTMNKGLCETVRNCTVTVIQTDSEFDVLERTWNELLSRSDASVFQTFEWLRTWWKYFGKGRRLHCLVFNSDGQVVGIAPMFKEWVKIFGVKIATHLQFMGPPLSDYVDVITLLGYESLVLSALAEYLESSSIEWDVFDIEDVHENSAVVKIFPEMLTDHGMPVYTYQGNVCPQSVLPDTWEMFLQGLGPNTRYNFKRKSKKLQQGFKTEVEVFEKETDDLVAGIDAFIKLHGDRWKSLGYPNAFDDVTHRAFHIEIARKFAHRGWLRLFFLKVNGFRVAVSFDFNYKNRIYMYQANSYGPEEIMRYSPGFLVNCVAIERGIREGMKIFDFLRGDESYKLDGMKAIPSKNWLIRGASPSFGGRIRFRIFLVYEVLKKSKDRILKEYYEFRKFKITRKPSVEVSVRYLKSRLGILLGLGFRYILRHSHVRGV